MSREKQIEEMAKCCTYYHNGNCCADRELLKGE